MLGCGESTNGLNTRFIYKRKRHNGYAMRIIPNLFAFVQNAQKRNYESLRQPSVPLPYGIIISYKHDGVMTPKLLLLMRGKLL